MTKFHREKYLDYEKRTGMFLLKIKGVSKSENFNNFYLNTSW